LTPDVAEPCDLPFEMRAEPARAAVLTLEFFLCGFLAKPFNRVECSTDISDVMAIDIEEFIDLEPGHSTARVPVGIVRLVGIYAEPVGREGISKGGHKELRWEMPPRGATPSNNATMGWWLENVMSWV
jgi:hypothetical protein